MKTERRKSEYSALRTKLALRLCLACLCACAAVLLCLAVVSGRLADSLVNLFAYVFRLDWNSAYYVYFFGIRRFIGAILVSAVIVFFVVFCVRLLVTGVIRYMDAISRAVDGIADGSAEEPSLPSELGFLENRLLKLKNSYERRDSLARESEQRKNDLVIYSAHDIKTPLTSVLGYLILLDGSPDLPEDERRKYVGIALQKTRELDAMINELFEITRYNLHDIELERSEICLSSMFGQLREELYPILRSSGKSLVLNIDDSLYVLGDGDKLARCFGNLLKNAAAYGESDSAVEVSASRRGEYAELRFRNRCRPISEQKLERLFDRFYRAEGGGSGSGLGLTIAKEIVLLHGGEIKAENVEGGVMFTVSLPCINKT